MSALLSGCVRNAVLENDVRNAQWKARTLATQHDLHLAEAALSAQLVELEALYQRAPTDPRVLSLLDGGYRLLAQGFIEARRLEAVAAGDSALAAQESELAADAEARARYYRDKLAPSEPQRSLQAELVDAEQACRAHAQHDYERRLTALLHRRQSRPEKRLELALLQRLARSWLAPPVAARCAFVAPAPARVPVPVPAPAPGSGTLQ